MMFVATQFRSLATNVRNREAVLSDRSTFFPTQAAARMELKMSVQHFIRTTIKMRGRRQTGMVRGTGTVWRTA